MAARTTGGRRLTAVEAIQVGMTYRACHRLVHLMAGGSQSTWKDPGLWAATSSTSSTALEGTTSQGSPGSTPERKMKLSQVADQGDESEFVVLPEARKAKYYTKYVAKVGGMPADLEDPTVEQISPIVRKVFTLGQPPYCDFAVWVPFAKPHQSFVVQDDGSFLAKMVPGPASFTHWQASYRVLRTTLVMTEVVSLANLMEWEALVERLNRQHPGCWGLIAAAEDRARGEYMSKTLAKVRLEIDQGATPPLGWNVDEPWDDIWGVVRTSPCARASHCPLSKSWQTAPFEAADRHFSQRWKSRRATQEAEERTGCAKRRGRRSSRQIERSCRASEKAQKVEAPRVLARRATPGTMGMAYAGGSHLENPAKAKVARLHQCTQCGSPEHPSKSCPVSKKT